MGEVHPCVLEGLTGSRLEERHHPTVIQPCQLDAGDRALSSEYSQRLSESMGLRQLVVAVGPDHKHLHGLLCRGQMA